ncbi:MAG: hypothetical protein QOG11_132 [Solirubrobacteraceae bacterium]|jgi:hypothetical protein|nr:hypothetical protein [Solirubrobacteraceae bacterium]
MPARQRLVLVGLAVVVLVVAFVIARGAGGDKAADTPPPVAATQGADTSTVTTPSTVPLTTTSAAPAPAVPTVIVRGGKPQGGVQRLTFSKGDQIAFRVRSDVADEIHVHGYDVKRDVPAGGTVTFSFRGTIDGIFVVELEGRGEQIASLEVTP